MIAWVVLRWGHGAFDVTGWGWMTLMLIAALVGAVVNHERKS